MSAQPAPYPVRVQGRLDPGLSRWLWLVKWLLVIPHYVVLAFLWAAFSLMSVIAFFAILFTGRYPRGIFDFNVGVLRWSWRVAFYAFAANGTDRYPPFTLGETDYPADLQIDFPARLSRGLVLVKWWLLAIPHYLVLAVFVGGGGWVITRSDGDIAYGGGLISLLVLIAVVALLFTGRYPRGIFDLVLGMNRWALRVAAYAGLMTDRYPPFRLDLGGDDPGQMTLEPPAAPAVQAPYPSGGRLAMVIVGSVLALLAAGLLTGGVASVVLDQTQRDDQGYLMTPAERFTTQTYALISEPVHADFDGPDWIPTRLLGTVKLRSDSAQDVFIGVGPAAAVDRYLAGVPRDEINDLSNDDRTAFPGRKRPAAPASQRFWVAQASGTGVQELRWKPRDGNWRAVAMAADGSPGVRAELSAGATVPDLEWVGIALLAGGAVFAAAAGGLIYAGTRREGTAR